MRIGIPKEVSTEEKRVALAPAGVDALTRKGHTVYIQSGAGEGCHFSDEDYQQVGAKVVYQKDEVFHRSECILKVKFLTDEDADLLLDNQILISFLHLAVQKKSIVRKLLKKKITAIGLEIVQDINGNFPVLTNMSEIAGQLSIQVAEELLTSKCDVGRGILMGGVPGVAPASVVIIGAGTVGKIAARSAHGMGAQVIVLDKDINRLREVDNMLHKAVTTVVANPYTISRGVKFADVLIGAVLIKSEKTPHIVTKEMVKTMKKGAVIIDVSIDQGGCIETSRPTSMASPTFIAEDVIHYCVPNMTARVARTASFSITNSSLPALIEIADNGLSNALMKDPGLVSGICTHDGYCSNETIARIHNIDYRKVHIFPKN